MKGDFTRFTFNRKKQYNGVRLQQGRVQLDADWNEQVDAQNHLARTQSSDVIGACGVPRKNGGFEIHPTDLIAEDMLITPANIKKKISKKKQIADAKQVVKRGEGDLSLTDVIPEGVVEEARAITGAADLQISTGRIYVDGIMSENIPQQEGQKFTLYSQQAFYPAAPSLATYAPGLYMIYLDIWERHMTAIEDPDIKEIALGGPDTATRTQTVWQVKLFSLASEDPRPTNCWDVPKVWTDFVQQQKGRMKAKVNKDIGSDDKPCIVPAAAGYTRLENQLYRVEIHKGGSINEATFKWSRDNGTVATRLLNIDIGKKLLTVADIGKDNTLNFDSDQWVEINDDTGILHGKPGTLVRLDSVNSNTLIIDEWPAAAPIPDLATAVVRRWDHKGTTEVVLQDGAIPLPQENETWIKLEDGIEVSFEFSQNAQFNTGDYWFIPARVVDADIDWPDNTFLPPHGIQHHYCRLALAQWNGTGFTDLHDCRPFFPALTEPDLYYVSGDGQEAMPGEKLPQPLRVAVSNCNRPIEGAWIKFQVKAGIGKLEPLATSIVLDLNGNPIPIPNPPAFLQLDAFIIPTDPDGGAKCYWHMQDVEPETDHPEQLVEVTLLKKPVDIQENALDIPLMFGASFGVAWQDRYGGARFPCSRDESVIPRLPELEALTVEKALDQLRENIALYHVSGDGQEARRGEELPQPLIVRVANGDWPYEGATVRFRVPANIGTIEPYSPEGSSSTGTVISATEILVTTDADGLAYCTWLLENGDVHSQQVEATLVEVEGSELHTTLISPSVVNFNANLSIAEEVSYTPHPVESLDPANTDNVQAAIDELYEIKVNRNGDTMTGPLYIDYDNTDKDEPAALVINSPGESGQNIFDFRLNGDNHSRLRTEANGQLYLGTMTEAAMNFLTADTPRVRITETGNVGIGTPTPEARLAINGGLHVGGDSDPGDDNLLVDGDCTIAGNLIVQGDTTTVNTATLEVEDNIIRVNRSASSTPTNPVGGLEVFRGTSMPLAQLLWNEGQAKWKVRDHVDIYDMAYGPNWITLTEDGLADGLHRHSRLYSDASARIPALSVNQIADVGIGNTAPQARLHVSSPATVVGNYTWTSPTDFDNVENTFTTINGVNSLRISGTGYTHNHVGDATTTVTVFIDLDQGAGSWVEVWSTEMLDGETFSFNNLVIVFPEQNVSGIRLRTSAIQSLTFHGWSNMAFTFRNDKSAAVFGNRVGIKTTAPLFDLDVNGIVNAGNYYINGVPLERSVGQWDIVSNGISYAGGNVGVGTVSPVGNLHVHAETGNSNVRISTNSTSANKVLDFYESGARQASIIAMGSGVANGPPNALTIYSAMTGAPVTMGTATGEKLRIGDDGDIDISGDLHVSGRLYGAATNAAGSASRIFTGRTTPAEAQWIQDGDNVVYAVIDTSAAGLGGIPMYFTNFIGNIGGRPLFVTSCVQNPTSNNFRFYISGPGITPKIAGAAGSTVDWMAVGVDPVRRVFTPTGPINFDLVASPAVRKFIRLDSESGPTAPTAPAAPTVTVKTP